MSSEECKWVIISRMLGREDQSDTIFQMHLSNFICQNILVSHLWGSNRRYAQLVSGLDSQRRGLGLDTLLLSRAYHFVLTDVCSVVSRTDQERKIDSSWFTSQVALNAFFFISTGISQSAGNAFMHGEWISDIIRLIKQKWTEVNIFCSITANSYCCGI